MSMHWTAGSTAADQSLSKFCEGLPQHFYFLSTSILK